MTHPIRATLAVRPRLTFPVIRCDDTVLPGTTTALATLTPQELSAHVIVPVNKKLPKTALLQQSAPLWHRTLSTTRELGPPHFSTPVLLSARNRWRPQLDSSDIFDRAVVIDGAKRLEAAFFYPTVNTIPIIVLYGLNTDAELALRKQLQLGREVSQSVQVRERVGTTAPRLVIEDSWVDLEVRSDPFIVLTSRGYSPAILVRRPASVFSEHILIGAKSLASELESLRCKEGTLLGMHLSVRKQSSERTATYQLRVRETSKD